MNKVHAVGHQNCALFGKRNWKGVVDFLVEWLEFQVDLIEQPRQLEYWRCVRGKNFKTGLRDVIIIVIGLLLI